MPRGAELSATDRAQAAWLWSRRDGVIAYLSASAILGAKWIDAYLPAELIHTNRRPPPLITVHTDELLSGVARTHPGVGAHHWTSPKTRTWDVERYHLLPELGWNDIRLTSATLHNTPQRFLDRVGAALIARGCPKTW
jgi:hypothetical protein